MTAAVDHRLSLGDRPAIEAALAGGAAAPSEHCFANLYLFRERHDYRLHDEPIPHVSGVTYDGQRHALPLAPLDAGDAERLFARGIDCLFPIGRDASEMAERLALRADF